VSSTCFEQPSVHPQEDLYMQFYSISFVHLYKQSGRCQDVFISMSIKQVFLTSTRLLIRMHGKNTINHHVQVFLMMSTWLLETYRRHYNRIKSLEKKVFIFMVLIAYIYIYIYITMHDSRKVKFQKPLKEWMSGKFYVTFWKNYRVYRNARLQD